MAEYRRALSALLRPFSVALDAEDMEACRGWSIAVRGERSSDAARKVRLGLWLWFVATARGSGEVIPAAAVAVFDAAAAKKDVDVGGIGAMRSGEVFVDE